MEETTAAIKQSCEHQKKGITTIYSSNSKPGTGRAFQKRCNEKTSKDCRINKVDMKPQKFLI